MGYRYPKELPEESRRRVRAEEILAGRDFEKAKQEADYWVDVRDLLRTYTLRVFLVFVREASELVRREIWGIVRLESESLEFLRVFTISARSDKGYAQDGRRIGEMVSNYSGGLLDHVERAFRKSPLWQEYEDIMLAVATAPSISVKAETQPHASISETPTVPVGWEDIEISFISDERVQVKVGPQRQTHNYAEMGFRDNRSGKPNQAWGMLRALAQAGGFIPNAARDSKDFIGMAKRVERMRQTLKAHFQIASDPVTLDVARGYCCRFKIGRAPSFEK
jgi:hypothetical protein